MNASEVTIAVYVDGTRVEVWGAPAGDLNEIAAGTVRPDGATVAVWARICAPPLRLVDARPDVVVPGRVGVGR